MAETAAAIEVGRQLMIAQRSRRRRESRSRMSPMSKVFSGELMESSGVRAGHGRLNGASRRRTGSGAVRTARAALRHSLMWVISLAPTRFNVT